MKTWQVLILGILLGLVASGLILLVASPPRGEPVQLIPPPTESPIIVHVSGAVFHPGVYPFAPESRVDDAIQAAGGLLPEADAALLNLAAPLHDGMKVLVYKKGEKQTSIQVDNSITFQAEETAVPVDNGPININTATQAELETLPMIGETKAREIISYRQSHGAFQTIEEIQDVQGIGDAIFEKIKDLITVNDLP